MASMADLLSLQVMVFFPLLDAKNTASNMAANSVVNTEQYDGKTNAAMMTPTIFVRTNEVAVSLLDPPVKINSQLYLCGRIVSLYN